MSTSDIDNGKSATTSELRLRSSFRGSGSPPSCLEMGEVGSRNSQFLTSRLLAIS